MRSIHNGHLDTRSATSRTAGATPSDLDRRPTPHDVTPRLVALGFGPQAADDLAAVHPADRIVDALDALEELGVDRRAADPVGWVQAAVTRRWDLSDVLAERRQREARLGAWDADRRQRAQAREAYADRRAIADRWATAISAALDDDQLAHAIRHVAVPVAGLGRPSMPVVRADLLGWAIDVHRRAPEVALPDALAADLDDSPTPVAVPEAPLPEPPTPAATATEEVEPLTARIAEAVATQPDLLADPAPSCEPDGPSTVAELGVELEW